MSHTMDIPLCSVHKRNQTVVRWLNPHTPSGRRRYRLELVSAGGRNEWRAIRLTDGRVVAQHVHRGFVIGTLERFELVATRFEDAVRDGRISTSWPRRDW
jgi:hypothetical protein